MEERGVPVETVINRLRPALAGVAGAETLLQPIEDLKVGAREGSGRFQYTINAENRETLREWLPRVMAVMNAQKSLTNVGTDQITNGLVTRLVIARDLAAKVGVSTAMIDQTLYDAFGQRQIALISRELDQIRVVLEIKGEDRADEAAIDQLFVPSANGDQVPLRSVTRRETVTAPVMITHQGQTPAATIFFDTIQGVSLGSAIQDIETAVTRLRMPDTLRLSFEGNARAFQASQLAQPWLFLMALAAVYIVLGVLYESYVHPLTILSTLPSTGLGALLGLMVFGMELSVVSFIGMLLLIGIAMKNAIILVDFAQYARRRGKINARDAMLQACLHRFRPILMTSITAILGALPLAFSSGLGASFRRPLGVAVVGGLMMAQFLTLYTTPIVYVMLDRLQWRRLQSDRE